MGTCRTAACSLDNVPDAPQLRSFPPDEQTPVAPLVFAASAASTPSPDPPAPLITSSLNLKRTMPDSTAANKRQRLDPIDPAAPVADDGFIQDRDAVESGGEDDEDEDKPKDKKAGRRKIKIEFIQDKSRRHITFSKRKAGIMKKARLCLRVRL